MNLKGKSFVNSQGKICTVKGVFENVTIFEDGTKVETRMVLNPDYYREFEIPNGQRTQENIYNAFNAPTNDVIDPNEFLNRRYSIPMFDKDAQPARNAVDYFVGDDTVSAYDEEAAKEELAKKYEHLGVKKDDAVVSQASEFKSNPLISQILEEEGITIDVPARQAQVREVSGRQPYPNQQKFEEDRAVSSRQIEVGTNDNFNSYIDPMIAVFKKSKMNTDFKFSLEIDKKIPKLAYIEMMEESCETSIIEYLADEFTDSILRNPNMIKNIIMEELHRMIDASNGRRKKVVPKETKIKAEVKTEKSKLTPKARVLPTPDIKDEKLNEGINKNN